MANKASNRRIAGLLLVICFGLALESCSDEREPRAETQQLGVRDLAAQLEKAGIGCVELVVRQPDAQNRERPSPVPGGIGIPQLAPGPVASEYGYCVLKGAPEFQGRPIASQILVFDDDEHLDRLPPKEMLAGGGPVPEQALVYGKTWEIYVFPADKAEAIAKVLEAEILRAAN